MDYSWKFDTLSRVTILRCFRLDRIYLGARQYIIESLSPQYAKFPIVNNVNLSESSSPTAQVLSILSSGTDSSSELFKLADKLDLTGDEFTGRNNRVCSIALGQDQDGQATQMLQQAVNRGH